MESFQEIRVKLTNIQVKLTNRTPFDNINPHQGILDPSLKSCSNYCSADLESRPETNDYETTSSSKVFESKSELQRLIK